MLSLDYSFAYPEALFAVGLASLVASGWPASSQEVAGSALLPSARTRHEAGFELTSSDGWIELTAESGAFKIRERFKLKEMTYDGRLELWIGDPDTPVCARGKR